MDCVDLPATGALCSEVPNFYRVGNVTLLGVGEYGVTEIAINRSEWSVKKKKLERASPRTGHGVSRTHCSSFAYLCPPEYHMSFSR